MLFKLYLYVYLIYLFIIYARDGAVKIFRACVKFPEGGKYGFF